MNVRVRKSELSGFANAPPSKSHTIRALILGTLANGTTRIENPLRSLDGLAPINACKMIGADISVRENSIIINGIDGKLRLPNRIIDVGNSGTSLRTLTGTCSLIEGCSFLTGDVSVMGRPIQPLLDALNNLGGICRILNDGGKAHVVVTGRIRGGTTCISGITSQFASSLLMCIPLAEKDSIISTCNLQEKPYVEMTISHLKRAGVTVDVDRKYKTFHVQGGQSYKAFRMRVPGDFSSASFLLAAAAITNSCITVDGLDMNDMQGDKRIVEILREMGADIHISGTRVTVKNIDLHGAELDLRDNPDLLPILAVVGSYAKGITILKNVAHARFKETDRIAVMAKELSRMGAHITERKDGLIIKQSKLRGTMVHGYNDHRVVMSLAVAGLVANGETIIDTAEATDVTFPNFLKTFRHLGANIMEDG